MKSSLRGYRGSKGTAENPGEKKQTERYNHKGHLNRDIRLYYTKNYSEDNIEQYSISITPGTKTIIGNNNVRQNRLLFKYKKLIQATWYLTPNSPFCPPRRSTPEIKLMNHRLPNFTLPSLSPLKSIRLSLEIHHRLIYFFF